MDDPTTTVREGYDALGRDYARWSASVESDPRHELVSRFAARLPDGARIADLGCGPGIPTTQELARRFDVVGVDVSPAQLELARANVPGATFIESDLRTVHLARGSLDGVAALYSLSHIPREDHPGLLEAFASWLKPEGLLLASLGAEDSAPWRGEWLGVDMFFNSLDADTYRQQLQRSGFSLLYDEIREMREPEGTAAFLWVIAEKTAVPFR